MKLQIFIAIRAVMLTVPTAETQSWLLKPANPASTDSYSVKTGITAAHTNPINEQGGCATGLGIAPSITL